MADPKTLIGNIKVSNTQPTDKIKNHPWLFPYSGYSLGNSLRNAYFYSQTAGSMLVSLDYPFINNAYGGTTQAVGGVVLNGTLHQIVRRSRFTFPYSTHLFVEWSYRANAVKGRTGDLTLRVEMTGSSTTAVLQAVTPIPEWTTDPTDPRQQQGFLEIAHNRQQRIYRETYLLPVEDNNALKGQNCWLNVYLQGDLDPSATSNAGSFIRHTPVQFTMFHKNLPQGDGT